MHSTLSPKPIDDPCDVVAVAPDTIRVAPSDDEISNLLQQAARLRSENQTRANADFSAGATAPPVDATFRPAVNDVVSWGERWPMARGGLRALMGLLLAVCVGLTAVAWKSYGDVAKRKAAKLATQFMLGMSSGPEKSPLAGPPASTADPANAADAGSLRSAPSRETTTGAVAPMDAPAVDSAQLLQSMARDLASLGRQFEQLKGSVEQLKATQQQTSREVARASEQNLRTRMSAPAPQRARKPVSSFMPPQVTTAPAAQQPAPYYAPRESQPQTQTMAEPPGMPELSSVPRPPMPVR